MLRQMRWYIGPSPVAWWGASSTHSHTPGVPCSSLILLLGNFRAMVCKWVVKASVSGVAHGNPAIRLLLWSVHCECFNANKCVFMWLDFLRFDNKMMKSEHFVMTTCGNYLEAWYWVAGDTQLADHARPCRIIVRQSVLDLVVVATDLEA